MYAVMMIYSGPDYDGFGPLSQIINVNIALYWYIETIDGV